MVFDLQKASLWKRISAFLFDGILFGVVAVLFAFLLAHAVGYDGYRNDLNERYAAYSEEYSVSLNPTDSEYEAMSDAEKGRLTAAYDAMSQDASVLRTYRMTMQLTLYSSL